MPRSPIIKRIELTVFTITVDNLVADARGSTVAFVPGGQPIGALERVFAKLGKAILKLIPGRREKTA